MNYLKLLSSQTVTRKTEESPNTKLRPSMIRKKKNQNQSLLVITNLQLVLSHGVNFPVYLDYLPKKVDLDKSGPPGKTRPTPSW